jgi:predicted RNase H-like nuclease (RuvC/YqgF family)
METFFSQPNTFLGWAGIISLVVFGAVAIYGLFDKRNKERTKEVNGSEDRLIDILQKTVSELETKVNKQSKDIENLTVEVHELKKDNEKYIKIFQGRDDATKEYQAKGLEAISKIDEMHNSMSTLVESIKNTNSAMEKLISLVGKSMDIAGDIAKK